MTRGASRDTVPKVTNLACTIGRPRFAPIRFGCDFDEGKTVRKWDRLKAGLLMTWVCISWSLAQGATAPAGPAGLTLTVTPAATGNQLVRASLPFPRGFVADAQMIEVVTSDGTSIGASLRPITWHTPAPGSLKSVRRGMLTFPGTFPTTAPATFTLRTKVAESEDDASPPVEIRCDGQVVSVVCRDGTTITARPLAPDPASAAPPKAETVESNRHYLWRRFKLADPQWPRIIEVRADALGTVVLIGHLQRNIAGDGRAPDFGWELRLPTGPAWLESGQQRTPVGVDPVKHPFQDGQACALTFGDARRVYHPAAPWRRRGFAEAATDSAGAVVYRYWRCRADEKVPMQQAAWHRAEVVVAPVDAAALTATLSYPHACRVEPAIWDELYRGGRPLALRAGSPLARLLDYHYEAIVRSAAVGDDWGNVTGYSDGVPAGGAFGMNRLNHCPAIFFEGYRSGDRRMIETAIAWCENFHDQSIWWGPDATGGTRYNNLLAMNKKPPDNDQSYMWRSNTAVNFCTKGYDSFFIAYEETGDPRMSEASAAQVEYAARNVFANRGECRNIGDAADFVRLYEYTGERRYMDETLRLFRELRAKLSAGDLFDQGGKPIAPDQPFIDDDAHGYSTGYAKPYIIGYALNGLPALARYAPDEPKLRDVVRAVADFLAESQDPLGGWRYPHPSSTTMLLNQAMEHAWQITQAAKLLGPRDSYLDAIERVLRQRLHGWQQTGKVLSSLSGWEMATGKIKTREAIYELYQRPADRDRRRDYTEGAYAFGSCPPEGLVYFAEVLEYYLEHRPESRLLEPPAPDEPLGQLLARVSKEKK